jgi:hypothetical protein
MIAGGAGAGGSSSGIAAPPSQMMIVPHGFGKGAIKEIPESELIKHKVRDIPGFVKAGNLSMVHALINYNVIG